MLQLRIPIPIRMRLDLDEGEGQIRTVPLINYWDSDFLQSGCAWLAGEVQSVGALCKYVGQYRMYFANPSAV